MLNSITTKLSNTFDKVVGLFGALLLLGVLMLHAFFNPVYGNCKQTIEGRSCDLIKWERE
jgi:hypothetical protein